MQSKARTVAAYLDELPADRRAAIEAVRKVILANVDGDIEEGMQYGAISYHVPHRIFPAGYHCDPSKPLPYAGLASQKNHMALYLFCSYVGGMGEATIREAYEKAGRRLDMGKSCLRFRSLQELDLDTIADVIRREPTRPFVERYLELVGPRGWKSAGAKKGAKKVAKKSEKRAVKKVAKKASASASRRARS